MLKVTELSGGRVNTRSLKASGGGVATLVVLLDTVATWMRSLEDEAHVLRATATTVASISIIVGIAVAVARTPWSSRQPGRLEKPKT